MNINTKYNPAIHHRRSIRLQGYDYSQPGLYFITICVHHKKCLFGEIINNENHSPEMKLNDAGQIAHQCWLDIPKHFPNVILHEFVIMPNHIHGIIELTIPVEANHNSPQNDEMMDDSPGINRANSDSPGINRANNDSPLQSPSKTIGSVVRGFKIGVTKWFRNNTDVETVWQRNYYEHIIRDEKSYQNISDYIIQNPLKWKGDKFYSK